MKSKIIGICLMFILCGCQSEPQKELSLTFKDIKTVEYGDQFDSQSLVDQVEGEIKSYPTVDTSFVGKQKLVFEVVDGENIKTFDYEIEIIDTKKPILELKKDKVEIELKSKFDPLTYFSSAKDPVDGELAYKKESDMKETDVAYYTYKNQVNTDIAGTYDVIYRAVDKNHNKVEKTLKVTVKEEKKVAVVADKPAQTTKPSTPAPEEPSTPKPTPPPQPEQPKQSNYNYVLESTVGTMKASQNVNKLVTVTSTSSTSRKGTLQYFVKSGGNWVQKLKVSCQLGKAGMGVGSEGSTRSPIGSYRFTHAYGIKSNPGSLMSYTKINSHHYWCGDQYYNQFVDDTITDHTGCRVDNDEHLIDYPRSYDYFASFNYNSSNIPGKGAAFFLHCIDPQYSYTAGCIAVSTSDMVYLLKNINTSTGLVISQISDITKY